MDDINQIVGKRIKEIRLERKLSREQVARRCGVVQQTIEKYEKGEVEISVRKLTQISNVLNVGVVYLLAPDNKNNEILESYVKKQIEFNKKLLTD